MAKYRVHGYPIRPIRFQEYLTGKGRPYWEWLVHVLMTKKKCGNEEKSGIRDLNGMPKQIQIHPAVYDNNNA